MHSSSEGIRNGELATCGALSSAEQAVRRHAEALRGTASGISSRPTAKPLFWLIKHVLYTNVWDFKLVPWYPPTIPAKGRWI
ncbi:hypothetical protein Metal_2716 [Methylomicrobium album BG8]|uniref:Uncharacterized protein n=1 Tax=Methylomicrobium album BG8 TaxID=686340 RepID=H8GKC7_METAL|nr:hypothetical protein Metal_2716 [Methylomicrobium album BG8]